jgi:MarR family transcriptional regulator, organic hydroperoxide resistance regulator
VTSPAGPSPAPGPAAAPEPADLLRLEHQVCFGLVTAARSVVSFYRPFLEPLGLTHPQYLVLLALWQHGELSVRRLSELLMLEPATVSPLLKRLEAMGMLTRQRAAADERQLRVTLTEEGRALRARAELIPPAIAAQLGMGADEFGQLRAVLDRLIAAMNQAAG